jgi:hypothetical protein
VEDKYVKAVSDKPVYFDIHPIKWLQIFSFDWSQIGFISVLSL